MSKTTTTQTVGCIPTMAPFRFDHALAFLGGFSPMVGEQQVDGHHLVKAMMLGGQPLAFTIWQDGDALHYRLDADCEIDAARERAAVERIGLFLSAGEELAPFYERAEEDPHFAPLARALRGFHHPRFLTPFECACWGVINQRVPRAEARSMKESLTRELGGRVVVGGKEHWAFPEAPAVVERGEAAIRTLLKSERKGRAVSALASAFCDVDERFLQQAPLSDVERWLRDIYGVGDFTSAFVLFRGLGRFVRQPMAGGLSEAAASVYGRALSPAEVLRISSGYRDWAGYWALYLRGSTFMATLRGEAVSRAS